MKSLVTELVLITELQGSPPQESPRSPDPAADDNLVLSDGRRYAVTITSVWSLLEDQGSFVVRLIQDFETSEDADLSKTLKVIAKMLVTSADKIGSITAERDHSNAATAKPLPPVPLQQLVKLPRAKKFNDIVNE
ncbi:hypothetical protein PsorP6_016404 [Peronosclerospora sorghi]|uniref:Uncharacterized protein n=1 Tax=Peronosclerospora sorghi TaxID=230839 RepID=A0ACC0VMJ7_9STRA|nr:hypothetical protein PsorP6_016404 [Peronosclerospora sorghi]